LRRGFSTREHPRGRDRRVRALCIAPLVLITITGRGRDEH